MYFRQKNNMIKLIIKFLVFLIPFFGFSQRAKLYAGFPSKDYYKNGSLRVDRNFKDGKLLGYKTFYKSGELKSNYVFNLKGYHDSIANFYYPNGKVKTVWNYKKGIVKKRIDYTIEGEIVKGKKKYQRLKECNSNLAYDRTNLNWIFRRAKLNSSLGFYDEALEDFNYIISKKNPKSVRESSQRSLYHAMAIDYANIEDYRKALSYNLKALSIEPDNQAVLNNTGNLFLRAKDYDLAMKYLDKCHAVNPNNYYAFFNKSKLYLDTGEYVKALNLIEKTIADERSHKLSKKNIGEERTIWVTRGELYQKTKQFDKAIIDLEKALKENSVNSYAFRCLALVYLDTNENEKACEALEKAKEYKFDKVYDTNEIELLLKSHCL